jgi:hypothetical protein
MCEPRSPASGVTTALRRHSSERQPRCGRRSQRRSRAASLYPRALIRQPPGGGRHRPSPSLLEPGPCTLPSRWAFAIPSRWRSSMTSRSNCATLPKTFSMRRPADVDVSSPMARMRRLAPLRSTLSTIRTKSRTERAKRSSLMARKIRSSLLENRTQRLKLPVAKKPLFVRIRPGISLGYRRNQITGTWVLRVADGRGGARTAAIGCGRRL